MKKFLSLVLVLVIATVALTSCTGAGMTMGTGGTSGTYYGYGGVLGQYIKNMTVNLLCGKYSLLFSTEFFMIITINK